MLGFSMSFLVAILLLSSFSFFVLAEADQQQQQQSSSSFYELLGIPQDADMLTIRKAFKKLALQKHPDKNPDDPDAHSAFVRINRAYEVLKDEELRRKYDQFGEKGLEEGGSGGGSGGGQQYQSWQFYNENFGIYDEDPEIITLGRGDFHEEVFQSGEIWFVNFYSTYCSHCHQLAPVWRKFAKSIPEGVARIGAVNCAEDPNLCQSQNVMGYPSLVLYPEQEWFEGERRVDVLLDFLLSRLPVQVLFPSASLPFKRPLLLELCSTEDCLSAEERKKIAAITSQLWMAFGVLDCAQRAKTLCESIGHSEGIFLMTYNNGENAEAKELYFADLADLRTQLLAELPSLDELDDIELEQLLQRAPNEHGGERGTGRRRNMAGSTLALLFGDDELLNEKEWRTLPLLFPDVEVRAVACFHLDGCAQMHAGRLPRPAFFRPDGGYDLHYGNIQMNVREVAKFVRRTMSSKLVVLNADSYWEARQSAGPANIWLIDHFAPWCPPCLRLLEELRKMPHEVGGRQINVGTLDCDAHRDICRQERVNSYPRIMLFIDADGTQKHSNVGFHTVDQMLEFISEALNPSLEALDPQNFEDKVRGSGRPYFVDFFAPWCGPCQQLAPEFRRLARRWSSSTSRHPSGQAAFGSVDCEQHRDLCAQENVHSYPKLRLYRPSQNGHFGAVDYPQNWWRNAETMTHWLNEMLPSLVLKIAGDFGNTVLDSTEPFLIDFYAPWCSHCVQFSPIFEKLAHLLDGQVRLGKVDCERFVWICQTADVDSFPQLLLYFGSVDRRRQNPRGVEVPHGGDAAKIARKVKQLLAEVGHGLHERDEL